MQGKPVLVGGRRETVPTLGLAGSTGEGSKEGRLIKIKNNGIIYEYSTVKLIISVS